MSFSLSFLHCHDFHKLFVVFSLLLRKAAALVQSAMIFTTILVKFGEGVQKVCLSSGQNVDLDTPPEQAVRAITCGHWTFGLGPVLL